MHDPETFFATSYKDNVDFVNELANGEMLWFSIETISLGFAWRQLVFFCVISLSEWK